MTGKTVAGRRLPSYAVRALAHTALLESDGAGLVPASPLKNSNDLAHGLDYKS